MTLSPPGPATLVFLLLVPLVLWRMYRRVRSLVGPQRVTRIRPWIRAILFPVLLAALAWITAMTHPERLAWLALGTAAGVGLAVYAFGKTTFEKRSEGWFYTPHAHIGIALSLVLVARVAWRAFEVATVGIGHGQGTQDFVRTPLTLAIVGLMAGYFATYAMALIRWRITMRRKRRPAPPEGDPGDPGKPGDSGNE